MVSMCRKRKIFIVAGSLLSLASDSAEWIITIGLSLTSICLVITMIKLNLVCLYQGTSTKPQQQEEGWAQNS